MSDSTTLWIVVLQAPLSMRFSRQEYWSGLPFSCLSNLTDPEIETASPADRFFTTGPPAKPKNPVEILVRDSYIGLPWWSSG